MGAVRLRSLIGSRLAVRPANVQTPSPARRRGARFSTPGPILVNPYYFMIRSTPDIANHYWILKIHEDERHVDFNGERSTTSAKHEYATADGVAHLFKCVTYLRHFNLLVISS